MPHTLPETEAYQRLTLRLPAPLLEAVTVAAGQERRSLNAQILWVLEDWLQDEEAELARLRRAVKT